MNFNNGDSVMHWTHGLGTILRLETMALSGENSLYYAIEIGNLIVWVPANEQLETRLRPPSDAAEFEQLTQILTHPGERLPKERFERKKLLLSWLEEGRSESLFRVIRSLATYRHFHPLTDDDQAILKRTRSALLGEWSYSMSISLAQAEHELQHLLTSHSSRIQEYPEDIQAERGEQEEVVKHGH